MIYLYRNTLLPAVYESYNETGGIMESCRCRDYRVNIGLTVHDFYPDNDTCNF